MKKRIVCIALTLCLLAAFLAMPVSAATPSEVYNYLKSEALNGYHNTSNGTYQFDAEIEDGVYFGGFYYESSRIFELSIFNDDMEVTLVLPANMAAPYTAYVLYYGVGRGETTVTPGTYTQDTKLSFSSYKGDTSVKAQLQQLLNDLLPEVVELTGVGIHPGGYFVKDLGFTKFTRHTYHLYDDGKVTKQMTCLVDGTKTYTCEVCGAVYTQTIPAPGYHTWGKSWVSLPATCLTDGVMGYECTACGEKKYEVIPAVGQHTWSKSWVSAPATCTSQGAMGYECAACGERKYEVIPATGHYWEIAEVLTPSLGDFHGTARYVCSNCGAAKEAPLCACEIFTDAPEEGDWAHAPIDWALLANITKGTSENKFSPEDGCTRAQVVTFLWRAAGRPEVKGAANPFVDVDGGDYFYEPVLWAARMGITTGTDETHFSPNDTCTRAQIVTFLWRYESKPSVGSVKNPFADVDKNEYYADPVLWAVKNGITTGTSETTFEPDATCTRAQVVTFLYRDCRANAVG